MTTQKIEINPFKWTLMAGGKFRAAQQLYFRGKQFLACAAWLDGANEGDGYVVRHQLSQGLELVLKALLLNKDYDKYEPMLHKPFGHDLEKLAAEVCSVYGHALRPKLATDLMRLNAFFKKHHFRYAHELESVFYPAEAFPIKQLSIRLLAVLNLADKVFIPPK